MKPDLVASLFRLADERYRILLRRQRGEAPPWTEHPVLARYHLCNVFRDDDAVSRFIMQRLLPLNPGNELPTVVVGRLVNHETALYALYPDGRLRLDWEEVLPGVVVNTHAYKVNTPLGLNNRVGITVLIRAALKAEWTQVNSLETATAAMASVGLGRFVAYQAAQDLKGSVLPEIPSDADHWTLIGPGSIRGALRLNGLDIAAWAETRGYARPKDGTRIGTVKESWLASAVRELVGRTDAETWALEQARALLTAARVEWPASWPEWHLGEAEHMLCEYDKVERWQALGFAGARRFQPRESRLFDKER